MPLKKKKQIRGADRRHLQCMYDLSSEFLSMQ